VTRPRHRRASDEDGFGCPSCYGDDAERAWGYYEDGLVVERELVGEPHFIVQLRRCAACGQQFVWIFSESVDWDGGEDAHHRSVVPLTEVEAQTLETESLVSLGGNRRHLVTDWPTDAPNATIAWSTGGIRLPRGRLR
jgi:hypothetical protein